MVSFWKKSNIKEAPFHVSTLRSHVNKIEKAIEEGAKDLNAHKVIDAINKVLHDVTDSGSERLRHAADHMQAAINAQNSDGSQNYMTLAVEALHAAVDEGCIPLHEAADSVEKALSSAITVARLYVRVAKLDAKAARELPDAATEAAADAFRTTTIVADAPLNAILMACDAALVAISTRRPDLPIIVSAADLVRSIHEAQHHVDESLIAVADLLETAIHSATSAIGVDASGGAELGATSSITFLNIEKLYV